MSSLFPTEITNLVELPYNIHDAIKLALVFLSYEELPKDERPPKRIWMDADRMSAWWEDVERKRDEKFGTDNGSTAGMQRNQVLDEMGLR